MTRFLQGFMSALIVVAIIRNDFKGIILGSLVILVTLFIEGFYEKDEEVEDEDKKDNTKHPGNPPR